MLKRSQFHFLLFYDVTLKRQAINACYQYLRMTFYFEIKDFKRTWIKLKTIV